jgi:hypothetical protein
VANRYEEAHMLTILVLALLIVMVSRSSIIDVNREQILTLSQLAKRLPRRRNDRPVHPATIHRWRHPGVRGVRLECVRIGGIWVTSLEAYQRWVDQLTTLDQRGESSTAAPERQRGQGMSSEEIEQRLDDFGIRSL